MTKDAGLPPEMSAYEREVRARLEAHWARKSRRREPLGWDLAATMKASGAVQAVTSKGGDAIPEPTREHVSKAGCTVRGGVDQVADKMADIALEPALRRVLQTLQLANDWVMELNDPRTVLKIAEKRGLVIQDIADLRNRDLKDCDRPLTRHTLK